MPCPPVSVFSTRTVQRASSEDQDAATALVWYWMRWSMPYSAAVSRTYARMLPASAIAVSERHGRNSYPNVCRSESDRTPG